MKAVLRGPELATILPIVEEAGIVAVEDGTMADCCICYGGDGTLLGAEREFPGLPKVPIRKRSNPSQVEETARDLLARVKQGQASVTLLPKLVARTGDRCLVAMNDVYIRNEDMTSAVRFVVEIDGLVHFGEVVGDGLVVATPFGSSAYYRSITNSVIHVGVGLAFNNSTEPVTHLVLSEQSRIDITITRGPAILAADNSPDAVRLTNGDRIRISHCEHQAVIWGIGNILRMDQALPSGSRRLRWLKPATERNRTRNEPTNGD